MANNQKKKTCKTQYRDFALINIEYTVNMEAAYKHIKALGTPRPNVVYRDFIKSDQNERASDDEIGVF